MVGSRRQLWISCRDAIVAGDANCLFGALRRLPLACASSMRSARFVYAFGIFSGADLDVDKISLLGLATILGKVECAHVILFVLRRCVVSSLSLWDGEDGSAFTVGALLECGSIMYRDAWCFYSERMYCFLCARVCRPVRVASLRVGP